MTSGGEGVRLKPIFYRGVGQWLVEHIGHCESVVLEMAGHISLLLGGRGYFHLVGGLGGAGAIDSGHAVGGRLVEYVIADGVLGDGGLLGILGIYLVALQLGGCQGGGVPLQQAVGCEGGVARCTKHLGGSCGCEQHGARFMAYPYGLQCEGRLLAGGVAGIVDDRAAVHSAFALTGNLGLDIDEILNLRSVGHVVNKVGDVQLHRLGGLQGTVVETYIFGLAAGQCESGEGLEGVGLGGVGVKAVAHGEAELRAVGIVHIDLHHAVGGALHGILGQLQAEVYELASAGLLNMYGYHVVAVGNDGLAASGGEVGHLIVGEVAGGGIDECAVEVNLHVLIIIYYHAQLGQLLLGKVEAHRLAEPDVGGGPPCAVGHIAQSVGAEA